MTAKSIGRTRTVLAALVFGLAGTPLFATDSAGASAAAVPSGTNAGAGGSNAASPASGPGAAASASASGADGGTASPGTTPATAGRPFAAMGATDRQIVEAIESALMRDTALQGAIFNVASAEGAVTLTGTARDPAQVDRAIGHAKSVAGVKSISNAVSVR